MDIFTGCHHLVQKLKSLRECNNRKYSLVWPSENLTIGKKIRPAGQIVAIKLIHMAHRGVICFMWIIYVFYHGFLFLDFWLSVELLSLWKCCPSSEAINKIWFPSHRTVHIDACSLEYLALSWGECFPGLCLHAFMLGVLQRYVYFWICIHMNNIFWTYWFFHWSFWVYSNHIFSYFDPCVSLKFAYLTLLTWRWSMRYSCMYSKTFPIFEFCIACNALGVFVVPFLLNTTYVPLFFLSCESC